MKLLERLKERANILKKEVIAIYLSMRDRRTPLLAKIMIVLTISYAFSPIDIIPDFIPVLGYLDDLIILPFMIAICIKLIPADVLAENRVKAQENIFVNKRTGIYFAVVIIVLWVGIAFFILYDRRT
ncbi:MAG TPA: YkvA family protein [Bacteroidales bacterium]|nr:YkvA family protein [Bacteroidales bacterium]